MALLGACSPSSDQGEAPPAAPVPASRIEHQRFGELPDDGRAIEMYTLRNSAGMTARILDYGGILVSLEVPDREGRLADVVLGGADGKGVAAGGGAYFGALIGRYGNRIAKGRFELDGESYQLTTNDGPNHLHGGKLGFDKVFWEVVPRTEPEAAALTLRYRSADGEEGYPGNLSVEVTYRLTDGNELEIDYRANTDHATPINLTHHSYFNLATQPGDPGPGVNDVLGHSLEILASAYTPVDETLIATGEIAPVAGTPFDFREPRALGEHISDDDQQLRRGRGYDHNFVLDRSDDGPDDLVLAARVYEPQTGRQMEVWTTEPGMQLYSGNFLDGSIVGKGGVPYRHRTGFCLETQHFPDSPNHPAFPSTVLRPESTFQSRTIYAFSAR